MYCPNPSCSESPDRPHLLIADRNGIEIDYCPKCRGVWLDRGELDKLIERAQANATPAPQAAPQREQYREPERDYRPQERRDDRQHIEHRPHYGAHHKSSGYDSYGKPRKKSILSEIFDF